MQNLQGVMSRSLLYLPQISSLESSTGGNQVGNKLNVEFHFKTQNNLDIRIFVFFNRASISCRSQTHGLCSIAKVISSLIFLIQC